MTRLFDIHFQYLNSRSEQAETRHFLDSSVLTSARTAGAAAVRKTCHCSFKLYPTSSNHLALPSLAARATFEKP